MTGLISLLTCTVALLKLLIAQGGCFSDFPHKLFALHLNTDVKTQTCLFVPNQSEPSTIVNAVHDWAYQFTNMNL